MRHEAKSACQFHIPSSSKGMLNEKSPNGDSLHLITLNKDIFIMLMRLLIHLTQIVLVFFVRNFQSGLKYCKLISYLFLGWNCTLVTCD